MDIPSPHITPNTEKQNPKKRKQTNPGDDKNVKRQKTTISEPHKSIVENCDYKSAGPRTLQPHGQIYELWPNASSVAWPVTMMKSHSKARTKVYPVTTDEAVERAWVPDDKVDWSERWDEYKPINYNDPVLLNKPWSDPDIGESKFKPTWNHLDGAVNRISHTGPYEVVNLCPRNPIGRTGMSGRGCLGRWGPNHAVDPIVTRWKRDQSNTLMTDHTSNLPILQFVAISKVDSEEWAIPGGMVGPWEKLSPALQREFGEDALVTIIAGPKEKAEICAQVDKLFKGGIELYKGYVDDVRNTDNAWMETVAMNFHDGTGESVGKFPLRGGQNAGGAAGVHWMDLTSSLKLYPNHVDFLEAVSKFRKAHW